MVPLAGAGLITLRQTPLKASANVGTTVTALIVAIAVIGDQAMAAPDRYSIYYSTSRGSSVL